MMTKEQDCPTLLKNALDEIVLLAAYVNHLQAKIDSLMLEFCPHEMTEEQIKTWEANQVKIDC